MRVGYITYVLAALALLTGCGWEPLPPPDPVPAEKVFLMYDNIGSWFDADVEEAGKAVAAGALDPDERVVVYERMPSGNVIYELVKDASAQEGYSRRLRKQYPEGVNSSLSMETIRTIVGDIRALFPENPQWGLAFGSHGMGWIPRSNTVPIGRKGGTSTEAPGHPFAELWADRENPQTRFFQSESREKLDISEFVEALDDWKWDFIILDDCFMASVEVLYQMRTLAEYIIASPTEIMKYGFPYDRVVKTIFNDWTDVVSVGEEFVDYYTNSVSDFPCGTVAVVKMDEMEGLAESIRRLNLKNNELTSVEGIQFYEGLYTPGHLFFDLDDYLSHIREKTMPAEFKAFRAQLERTVVYADHTERFFSDFGDAYIPVTHFSGLNVFIPWNSTVSMLDMYTKTEWWNAVYN